MHDHSHASHHGSSNIGLAFFLNLFFTVIEFIGGFLTNSTAIMADAVHDLGDSLSLGLGWILARLSGREADRSFSYGYLRFSLLGAVINGIVLTLGSIWVLGEAIPRLQDPPMPMAPGMIVLALFGILVNGYAAYRLSAGKTLNERVLNWHLLEDVLGWTAVLVVAVVLLFVDWPILDPILSIGFTLFILVNVLKNLVTTIRLFLQAVPDELLYRDIQQALESFEFAASVHHLQLWSLDGEHHVLTAHISLRGVTGLGELEVLKRQIAQGLQRFDLAHTTIEFEFDGEVCRDA